MDRELPKALTQAERSARWYAKLKADHERYNIRLKKGNEWRRKYGQKGCKLTLDDRQKIRAHQILTRLENGL